MSSHPGRSLIASLERRFGHLAIPNLIRWIGVFQLTVWGLLWFSPNTLDYLWFDRTEIMSGQVWRLITFIFIPRALNPILVLFAVFFLWFIADALENEWGPFRVNLYVGFTVLCLIILGMIPNWGDSVNHAVIILFFSTVFVPFATIFPDQIINLLGVIPVKAKWLALADVGFLVYLALGEPKFILVAVAGFIPYFVVFVPGFIRDFKTHSDNATRRAAFQSRVKAAEGDSFHTCGACGKTDTAHPELEFRVAADGEEYCADCLAARAAKQT